MRKLLIISLFLAIFNSIYSQCREYIKAIAPDALKPYILDGNFLAPIVYEGDKVELKRTFLAGQHYKIMVLGMDIWQKFITIKDEDGFILFQNFSTNNSSSEPCSFTDYEGNTIPCLGVNYFEFIPEQTTTLDIIVKIEQKAKRKKDRIQGCLGIVVGYLPKQLVKKDSSTTDQ